VPGQLKGSLVAGLPGIGRVLHQARVLLTVAVPSRASTEAGAAPKAPPIVVPPAGRAPEVVAVEREAVEEEVPGVVEEVAPEVVEAEVGAAGGDKHDWNNGIIKNAGILE
jgi:hypothetical protein